MRLPAILAAVVLIMTCLPAGGQTPAGPALRISEILADPDTTLEQREFIELWNSGDSAIALAGWKIRDAPTTSGSTNTFTFPAWSLAPNGRVVVWGAGLADGRGPAWSNPTVWNNAGDGATVLDATGAIIDWFGYGTATAAPGFANRTIPTAAIKGHALQLQQGTWSQGLPTPGSAPGAIAGALEVDIANVPPAVSFAWLPLSLRPGAAIAVTFTVDDANGPTDVKTWTLLSGSGTLATGTGAGLHQVQLSAPPSEGPWPLSLTASDQAGAAGTATASILIRSSTLSVVLPVGPLQFGPARPGQDDVSALATVEVRNDGEASVAPLVDISPFATAGGGSFAAEGHVLLGLGTGNITWIPYTSALLPLPPLAPGANCTLSFRLHGMPSSLAVGAYGASFAVVAP